VAQGEYLFSQGGNLVPKVGYRNSGLFEVKAVLDRNEKARPQTFVTARGIEYFAAKLAGVSLRRKAA
jgi:phage antirepressor YoqD-like protein